MEKQINELLSAGAILAGTKPSETWGGGGWRQRKQGTTEWNWLGETTWLTAGHSLYFIIFHFIILLFYFSDEETESFTGDHMPSKSRTGAGTRV